MPLEDVCNAVAYVLRQVPGIQAAITDAPDLLPETRTIVVYPDPGQSSPLAHRGARGGIPFINRDNIVIEFHNRVSTSDRGSYLPETTNLFDRIRRELWSASERDRFGETVMVMHGVDTQHYGELGWDAQETFGFRLLLDVSHSDLSNTDGVATGTDT